MFVTEYNGNVRDGIGLLYFYREYLKMKMVIFLIALVCLLCGFFYYQGVRSGKQAPLVWSAGVIPVCGEKPNCVCSLQDPLDEHYIEPIALGDHDVADVTAAIESIGGEIITHDGVTIQAIFSSGIFRFVDDLLVQVDGGKLNVRSSSRVGHSDFGANRKRVEQLRQALS